MKKQFYGYLRVSTDKQDLDAQRLGVLDYLEKVGSKDFKLITDKASGSISWRKRELQSVIDNCSSGDTLVISELSRVGRSTVDILEFLKEACEKGLQVHSVKNNMTFDGSIQSTIFSTVMGLAAEIEREFIRARTVEGLAKAKLNGVKLGRPKGAKSEKKLDKKSAEVIKLHQAGVAKVAIARLLDVSRSTVERYIINLDNGAQE